MEKYYDGDQETFFKEAHVINPFNKPNIITRPKVTMGSNGSFVLYILNCVSCHHYFLLQAKKSGTEECEICFSFFPPSVSDSALADLTLIAFDLMPFLILQMMTGLECGHKFCTHCWGEYLTTKIMEEGLGQSISCAAHGCDIIVDDVTVMKLVPDSRVKLKYQHLITNSFVEVTIRISLRNQDDHDLISFLLFIAVQSPATLVSIRRLYLCCESDLRRI